MTIQSHCCYIVSLVSCHTFEAQSIDILGLRSIWIWLKKAPLLLHKSAFYFWYVLSLLMFLWQQTRQIVIQWICYWSICGSTKTLNPPFDDANPDSKVHGANMGPIWGRQDPGGPHVGPMNFAITGSHPFPHPRVHKATWHFEDIEGYSGIWALPMPNISEKAWKPIHISYHFLPLKRWQLLKLSHQEDNNSHIKND